MKAIAILLIALFLAAVDFFLITGMREAVVRRVHSKSTMQNLVMHSWRERGYHTGILITTTFLSFAVGDFIGEVFSLSDSVMIGIAFVLFLGLEGWSFVGSILFERDAESKHKQTLEDQHRREYERLKVEYQQCRARMETEPGDPDLLDEGALAREKLLQLEMLRIERRARELGFRPPGDMLARFRAIDQQSTAQRLVS